MFTEQFLLCAAITVDATLYDVFIPCQGRIVLWTQYAEKVAREVGNKVRLADSGWAAGKQTIPFCVLLHP
jgi:hypothetical protein